MTTRQPGGRQPDNRQPENRQPDAAAAAPVVEVHIVTRIDQPSTGGSYGDPYGIKTGVIQ